MIRRGYQTGPGAADFQVQEALDNGAKIIRYQILSFNTDHDRWLSDSLAQTHLFFENIYPKFRDTIFVLDLHRAPNVKWVREYWDLVLPTVLKDPSRIIIDILNEPALSDSGCARLMREMVRRIRRSSKTVRISVTSAYGDPTRFRHVPFFENDENIFYQFHFYLPMEFTHQGVYEYPLGKEYPTTRNNSARMRKNLDPIYKFRAKYPKAHLYCGEFSCINYTDPKSRAAWTRDCIINLKRLKCSWTWHAWREFPGWQPDGRTLEILTNNMR